jgi:hypothetical protein
MRRRPPASNSWPVGLFFRFAGRCDGDRTPVLAVVPAIAPASPLWPEGQIPCRHQTPLRQHPRQYHLLALGLPRSRSRPARRRCSSMAGLFGRSLPSPGTATQRRDSESPPAISVVDALACIAAYAAIGSSAAGRWPPPPTPRRQRSRPGGGTRQSAPLHSPNRARGRVISPVDPRLPIYALLRQRLRQNDPMSKRDTA